MKKILLSFILICFLVPSLKAQTFYFGGSGTWTGSVWSTTNSVPYTTAWSSGGDAIFNIAGTITGASTNFTSITVNDDITMTASNTLGTSGTIANITVAVTKTFDMSSQNISTVAGTGLIKNGLGVLAIGSGNAYPAGLTINTGIVICKGINGLGATMTINGGTLAANSTKTFNLVPSNIAVGGDFTLGATTGLASSTANLNFPNTTVNLGASNRTITLNGTGTNTFGGVVSGTGGLATGTGTGSTGTLLLSGANTYSGATTLSGGTLTLGAAGVIPDASPVTFNGGTLKSGVTTGFTETFSTVALTDNSTLALGTGVHSLIFSASNGITWTAAKTLTVTGWTGGYNGTTGTAGKIFVGNSATGLTAPQLAQIKFFNGTINYDATILSTGEAVPSTITVLPISLTSFTGKPVDKSILLNWSAASEDNNNYYSVRHSSDGRTFTAIGKLAGAGTSTTVKDYSFLDENPGAGTNYYQLVQHDFDGRTSTSNVISVDSKIAATSLSVYASSSEVKIKISSPNQTKGVVQLFDIVGRKLSESAVSLNKGYNSVSLPVSLKSGVHFVRYTTEGEVLHAKFMKQ